MNPTFKKYLPYLTIASIFGAGWIRCHLHEQEIRNELDKAWTAIYEEDQDYFNEFYRPEK